MKVISLGSFTVVHLCYAHIMHRLSHNLMKSFTIDKTLRQLILHTFAAIFQYFYGRNQLYYHIIVQCVHKIYSWLS